MSSPNPGSGSAVGGIPTKWLLIAGGGALVAFFLFQNKGGGENQADQGANAQYLGPNAALAIGDLQNQMLTQSGIIQDYAEHRFDSLQSSLDTAAAGLGDQLTQNYDYSRGLQQSVLGLYQPVLTSGSGSVQDRANWWAWLQGKFKAYNLGDLPDFDPSQDYWGTSGAYPVNASEAAGGSDFAPVSGTSL